MKQDVRMEMTGHLMTSSLSDPAIKRHLHANILREASTNQIKKRSDDVLTNEASRRTSPILCVKPTDVIRPSSEIDVVDAVDSNNNVVLSVDKVTYDTTCPDSEVVGREVVKIDDENIRHDNGDGFMFKKSKRKKGSIDEILSQLGAKKRKEAMIGREKEQTHLHASGDPTHHHTSLVPSCDRTKNEKLSAASECENVSCSTELQRCGDVNKDSGAHDEVSPNGSRKPKTERFLVDTHCTERARSSGKERIPKTEEQAESLRTHPVTKIITHSHRDHIEPAFQHVYYTDPNTSTLHHERGHFYRRERGRVVEGGHGVGAHLYSTRPDDQRCSSSAFYNVSSTRSGHGHPVRPPNVVPERHFPERNQIKIQDKTYLNHQPPPQDKVYPSHLPLRPPESMAHSVVERNYSLVVAAEKKFPEQLHKTTDRVFSGLSLRSKQVERSFFEPSNLGTHHEHLDDKNHNNHLQQINHHNNHHNPNNNPNHHTLKTSNLATTKNENEPTTTTTSTTTASRKRNKETKEEKERYPNLSNSQLQRRLVANARERSRVHALSTAFESLRTAVPSYSPEQKLSKLTILRVAINYINSLQQVSQQFSLIDSDRLLSPTNFKIFNL